MNGALVVAFCSFCHLHGLGDGTLRVLESGNPLSLSQSAF